jgi:hypothetical protein
MEKIEINKILMDKSSFSLREVLFRSEEHLYNDSFDKLGILNPVVVWRDGESFHLVDGEKRIQYAKQNGMTTIDAVVLQEDTPVTDIITLILCDKREDIMSSIMNRVQFICFAISLKAAEEWMVESLCVPPGLKPHAETLRNCERINRMTEELRLFCHEKKFSFKQLINLSSYPDDLLGLLVEWNRFLHLTASTMDEIASNLRDWLRSKNKSVDDLKNDAEIMEILGSSMDTRDKTGSLRQLVRTRQFPVLSEVNSRIEKSVSDLKLPKEIGIKWDRTLENKNAALSININDPEKWQRLLDALNSKELKKALKDILDEL